MRQPELQTTAPLDPDPKWPAGYIEALRQAGAHEKKHSVLRFVGAQVFRALSGPAPTGTGEGRDRGVPVRNGQASRSVELAGAAGPERDRNVL